MIDTPRYAEKVGFERYVKRMRSWVAETFQEEGFNYYLIHARKEPELTSEMVAGESPSVLYGGISPFDAHRRYLGVVFMSLGRGATLGLVS